MIDTEYTDEITCPYCGYADEYTDKCEGVFSMHCANCDRIFVVERHVEVTYSTSRPSANRHPVYGAEHLECEICGETGGMKGRSDVCDHLVCTDCAAMYADCCDEYREVLEQTKEKQ
jgi:hypothetical protein